MTAHPLLVSDGVHTVKCLLHSVPDSSLGGLFTPARMSLCHLSRPHRLIGQVDVHSGLRIIIPPRSLKRKLKELESDDPHLDIQLHKVASFAPMEISLAHLFSQQMVGDPWPGIEELQRAPMLM